MRFLNLDDPWHADWLSR